LILQQFASDNYEIDFSYKNIQENVRNYNCNIVD